MSTKDGIKKKGTSARPSIYLLIMENRLEPKRCVCFPATFDEFLKSIRNTYKNIKEIKALFSEIGEPVTSVHDLEPSMLVYVAVQSKEFCIAPKLSRRQETKDTNKPKQPRIFGSQQNKIDFSKEPKVFKSKAMKRISKQQSDEELLSGTHCFYVNSDFEQSITQLEKEESISTKSQNEMPDTKNKPKSKIPIRMNSKSKDKSQQEERKETIEEISDISLLTNSLAQSNSSFKIEDLPEEATQSPGKLLKESDVDDFNFEEDTEVIKTSEIQKSPNATIENAEEEECAERMGAIQSVFDCFTNETTYEKAMKVIEKLPSYVQSFFSNVSDISDFHSKSYYFNGVKLMKQFGFLDPVQDETIKASRKLIHNHRFYSGKSISYHFDICITGPYQTGKSCFLSQLANQLMLDLIVTDSWRRQPIIFIGTEDVLYSDSPITLFARFVDIAFKNLEWHCPLLKPALPTLIKGFLAVTTGEGAYIPKIIPHEKANMIRHHLADLSYAFTEGTLLTWAALCLGLPAKLLSIFDYGAPIYVFDDADVLGTLEIASQGQVGSGNIQLIDAMPAVFGTSFITAAGGNSGVLSPATHVSTLGLLEEVPYQESVLSIKVNSVGILKVAAEHVGGNPVFANVWRRLHEILDELDAMEEEEGEEEDVEERKFELETRSHEVAQILLGKVFEEGGGVQVASVKRQ